VDEVVGPGMRSSRPAHERVRGRPRAAHACRRGRGRRAGRDVGGRSSRRRDISLRAMTRSAMSGTAIRVGGARSSASGARGGAGPAAIRAVRPTRGVPWSPRRGERPSRMWREVLAGRGGRRAFLGERCGPDVDAGVSSVPGPPDPAVGSQIVVDRRRGAFSSRDPGAVADLPRLGQRSWASRRGGGPAGVSGSRDRVERGCASGAG